MKVLIVGQGGREHVLAWKMSQSPDVEHIYCAPGNAGTAMEGTNVDIGVDNIAGMVQFAKDNSIDLTVIGPEAPLVDGMADAFEAAGLKVFGPSKAAAELEGSKVFAKKIMKKAGVPTADFHVFKDAQRAMEFVEDRSEQQWVIKADGLAAGKGVLVCQSKQEARAAIQTVMVEQAFGEAGKQMVIEECLVGEEVSILAIVDGRTIVPLETSQDHKRAMDGDEGPNTGGMGAYCPAPIVTEPMMDDIIEDILVPIVHALKMEGINFRGVLYAGLMITAQGPKVLEFNVRFGDPEAQPVLFRLKSDLTKILAAAAAGKLSEIDPLEWDDRPSICVVMASDGYPGPYQKGYEIRGIAEADQLPDTKVFHAGTTLRGDKVVNDGGRVLGVTVMGDNIANAKLKAYQAVKCIRWDGAWCRKDISDKARR